jgi:hypothetical protein
MTNFSVVTMRWSLVNTFLVVPMGVLLSRCWTVACSFGSWQPWPSSQGVPHHGRATLPVRAVILLFIGMEQWWPDSRPQQPVPVGRLGHGLRCHLPHDQR